MDLDAVQRLLPALVAVARPELADQFLDAGIDVGAVEGGDAGIGEGHHVTGRIVADGRAVAAGQLPAAADHARDVIAGRERDALHGRYALEIGTAVVAAWLNLRRPRRRMRNRVEQLGSGHATSASLVIQSLAWVGRCLAGSSGSTAARE